LYISLVNISADKMKRRKIVFWLDSGHGYTYQEVCSLCDYHEQTGLMDVGMTDADIVRFAKTYLSDDLSLDGELDPAGGYGIHSHI
jgi:hypothetical protein